MKKFFLAVMALFMSFTANAFEFDGIDLNGSVADITKQVSAKGYVFDQEKMPLRETARALKSSLHSTMSM